VGREESNEGTTLLRGLLSTRSGQRRMHFLERVEHAAQRHGFGNFEQHLMAACDLRVAQQGCWEFDADQAHARVWTSTESTGGRCSVMVVQSSPPLGEQ